MPHIQITAPESHLTQSQKDVLVSELSNAVLISEGAPIEDAGAQSLVWAYYDERPKAGVYVGGKNLQEPPFRVAVTTPQGALDQNSRDALIAHIGQIIDKHVGVFADGRLNHWAMLYEVSEGSWGGGGQVFPLAGIQAAMNIKTA